MIIMCSTQYHTLHSGPRLRRQVGVRRTSASLSCRLVGSKQTEYFLFKVCRSMASFDWPRWSTSRHNQVTGAEHKNAVDLHRFSIFAHLLHAKLSHAQWCRAWAFAHRSRMSILPFRSARSLILIHFVGSGRALPHNVMLLVFPDCP